MKIIIPCWVRHSTLLGASLLGLMSPVVAGETGTPLSLEECLQRAISRNSALEGSYHRYLAATKVSAQVTAFPEPQISWTHFVEQVQTRTGPQENQFMVSQTIPWLGKLRLRGELANHEAEAARLRHEDARLSLIRDVSLAYYDYAYLAKEMEIVKGSRALLARLTPINAEQIRAGAPLAQQLTLELALGRIDSHLDDLVGRRGEASARLRAMMGEDSAKLERPPLPWPNLSDQGVGTSGDSTDSPPRLRENHPQLATLDEMTASAKTRTRLARKNAVPDPVIGANVIDIGDRGETATGITIGFRVPLAFRKYRAERAEAEEKEHAALADREEAARRLHAELVGAWERLQSQTRTVDRYRAELMPAADRIITLSEESYRAGSATIREVIEDQRDALEVRMAYWRAVADFQSSAVRVDTLTGDHHFPNLP